MEVSNATDDQMELTRSYELKQLPEKAKESAILAHEVLDIIIDFIQPGIKESEVKQYALTVFADHGIERTWHQPYVRFADHTLLTFKGKAKEDYSLGEVDIAFVDIGIVKDGIEGDAGRTIVFGKLPEHHRLQQASEAIFSEARQFWKQTDPTGIELYEYIQLLVEKMDVKFNLDPAGHLIGAFPHRGWKKGINHYPEKVAAGCWILEIQICNVSQQCGAFYEDLLY